MTGFDVFRKLMDVDLVLQDGSQMIAVRMFLESVNEDHPSLLKLGREIDAFQARINMLVTASEAQWKP